MFTGVLKTETSFVLHTLRQYVQSQSLGSWFPLGVNRRPVRWRDIKGPYEIPVLVRRTNFPVVLLDIEGKSYILNPRDVGGCCFLDTPLTGPTPETRPHTEKRDEDKS